MSWLYINSFIAIQMSLKFVHKGPTVDKPTLVYIMVLYCEPMMAWFADAYLRHSASIV